MDQPGKLKKPAFKLKHHMQRKTGWCHASRCQQESEVVLEQKAAAPYRVSRLELCDKHWIKHCGKD